MATLPEPIHSVAAKVYDYWLQRGDSEPVRGYLGASIIGGSCDRALWYGFRFCSPRQFDGRIYRLFERGRNEEEIVFEELRAIGVDVRPFDADGKQWGISAVAGHFRGHLDAAVLGTPYSKTHWSVLEVKTHSTKSFDELVKAGVQVAKPEHFAQMQIYMGHTGMERAMYYAVCKNDDRIHTEWLHFDQTEFDKIMQRAERVITAAEPPIKLREDPTYYICKMCDHAAVCHGTQAPEVSCRSCAHSTPETDEKWNGAGVWTCSCGTDKALVTLPIDHQRTGCDSHRYIPILLDKWAEYMGTPDGENPEYRNKLTGKSFTNGDYSSQEIHACQDKRAIGNADVNALRSAFGAKVAA